MVAKIFRDPNEERASYFKDVEMQMQAKELAERYNRKNPPKKVCIGHLGVAVLPMGVLELSNPWCNLEYGRSLDRSRCLPMEPIYSVTYSVTYSAVAVVLTFI